MNILNKIEEFEKTNNFSHYSIDFKNKIVYFMNLSTGKKDIIISFENL